MPVRQKPRFNPKPRESVSSSGSQIHLWRSPGVARACLKGVGKTTRKVLLVPLPDPAANGLSRVKVEGTQIVEAVTVVGVGVGVEHLIQPRNLSVEHLLAKVRGGINQNLLLRIAPRNQNGRTQPLVPWLRAQTNRTAAANHWSRLVPEPKNTNFNWNSRAHSGRNPP